MEIPKTMGLVVDVGDGVPDNRILKLVMATEKALLLRYEQHKQWVPKWALWQTSEHSYKLKDITGNNQLEEFFDYVRNTKQPESI